MHESPQPPKKEYSKECVDPVPPTLMISRDCQDGDTGVRINYENEHFGHNNYFLNNTAKGVISGFLKSNLLILIYLSV